MTQLEKVLYTAKTHTTGGRDGASRSSDGRLDVKLSSPGTAGSGTNPEQLFAAGWSACFIGAMGVAAGKMKVTLPADRAVDAEVDLGTTDGGYLLRARLNVSLPGSGSRGRPVNRGRRAPDLPVFQGHSRQHRRRNQPGLEQTGMSERCVGSTQDSRLQKDVPMSAAPLHETIGKQQLDRRAGRLGLALGTDLGSRGAAYRPIRLGTGPLMDWRHEVHRLRSRGHFGVRIQQPLDVLGLSVV